MKFLVVDDEFVIRIKMAKFDAEDGGHRDFV
jgi:hypothetical protein